MCKNCILFLHNFYTKNETPLLLRIIIKKKGGVTMPCIYCVEDDENIRELVAYALESQQFETKTFADGEAFTTPSKKDP